MLAAASFTGLVLAGKPIAQQIGPLRLATLETTVAALLMIPWAVSAFPEAVAFLVAALILGVLLTGLAGYVYWRSVAALPVATVAVLSYMEPASAVVWAALFLGESGDLVTWFGVGLGPDCRDSSRTGRAARWFRSSNRWPAKAGLHADGGNAA